MKNFFVNWGITKQGMTEYYTRKSWNARRKGEDDGEKCVGKIHSAKIWPGKIYDLYEKIESERKYGYFLRYIWKITDTVDRGTESVAERTVGDGTDFNKN